MYSSTRGGVLRVSFEEALLSGYAKDGGILVPDVIPKLRLETIQSWSKLSYVELVKKIVPMFVAEVDIPRAHLTALLDKAFQRFSIPEVVKMAPLKDGLNVLELFHGPTLAFKDLALSCVGHLMDYFLSRRRKHCTVLVGTSGDTGSAAIEAMRGLKWVDIIVLLPRGRCTRVQELQMTTAIDDNIHIFRVDGTPDALDEPIRKCFADSQFVSSHNLCSINSINWVRILVQTVHYFYAYLQACPICDNVVEIVVPTGACGNVAAGCIAKEMGLPLKLVCSVNCNDVVARVIDIGVYSIEGPVVQSLASAMDIQMAYNIERLLWLFSAGDTARVGHVMREFEKKGRVVIPNDISAKMRTTLQCYTATDENIKDALRRCWDENQYLVCPHTATALSYHYHSTNNSDSSSGGRVCLATASPAKFEEVILFVGLTPQPTPEIIALDALPTKYQDMERDDDWLTMLKDCIINIDKQRQLI